MFDTSSKQKSFFCYLRQEDEDVSLSAVSAVLIAYLRVRNILIN